MALSIAVTGATGFIGRHLTAHWKASGHRVLGVKRGGTPPPTAQPWWDPAAGKIDAASFEGLDGLVHLAGEPIGRRWTPGRRRRILESRGQGTRLLASTLAGLKRPPRVLVSASATGYYGDRGDEVLTEESRGGSGFLADVCRTWERALQPAQDTGIRVVALRQGIVLGRDGGALKRMLLPFRLGLGGRLGSGRQYWSWISREDLLRAYDFALEKSLKGPMNAVAPQPVTNAEFSRTLASVLRRPHVVPAPALALRLAFGEMADEALLYSQRCVPKRLQEAGFSFRHATLESALRTELS